MKTAEEWESIFNQEYGLAIASVKRIRAIQLDALKEAAEIARQSIAHELDCNFVKHKQECYCRVGLETASIHDAILTRIRELESSTENK